KVHLFVRGKALRASRSMQDRLAEQTKVKVHLSTGVDDVYGDTDADGRNGSPVQGVHVRELGQGSTATQDIPIRGLFYGIGHRPNTDLLEVIGGQESL
ncbi:unnamed protein product, partial [Discosporangium mesarthrocarpum]